MTLALLANIRTVSCIALLVACSTPAFCQDDDSDNSEQDYAVVETPDVRRIVMFNSGLAQIVHQARVSGNCQMNLQFDRRDINDVLKSLIFDDASGSVRPVEYKPAPDNEDVAAYELGPAMTLAQMLQKYRGETVKLQSGDAAISGAILNVENRQEKDSLVETVSLLNEDGIVSVAINELASIQFENEELRKDLSLAMSGLKKSRTTETKQLNLLFQAQDNGERDVKFSYLVASPVWRMTYRLDLKKENSPIQGWAHIDNSSSLDWKDIRLELRSGRPQSYYVDMFSPVMAQRTTMGLELFGLNTNNLLPGSANKGKRLSAGRGGGGGGFGGGGFGGGGRPTGAVFGGPGDDEDRDESLRDQGKMLDINAAVQAAGNVGRTQEMVVFEIDEPVSLSSGRSAMVPVLTTEVPIELFSMFDLSQGRAMASLVGQIENKTSTPLVPGPATIYRDGNFVGDAALPRIEMGQKSEVVFGFDPAVSISVQSLPQKSTTRSAKLNGNDVVVDVEIARSVSYTIKNEDSEDRKILLKVRLQDETVSPKPDLTRGAAPNYIGLYELDCDGDSSIQVTITQSKSQVKERNIGAFTEYSLEKWQKDKAEVDAEIAVRVATIGKSAKKLADLESQIIEQRNQRTKIREEQQRITSIIGALRNERSAAQQYIENLSKTESDLQMRRKKIEDLESLIESAKEELQELKYGKTSSTNSTNRE